MQRETRNLGHHKAKKIKSVNRAPYSGEGEDGDMRINKGVLYIKDLGVWYVFGHGRKVVGESHLVAPVPLTDSTGTTASAISDSLVTIGSSFHEGNIELNMSSLGAKINEILTLIRKML